MNQSGNMKKPIMLSMKQTMVKFDIPSGRFFEGVQIELATQNNIVTESYPHPSLYK